MTCIWAFSPYMQAILMQAGPALLLDRARQPASGSRFWDTVEGQSTVNDLIIAIWFLASGPRMPLVVWMQEDHPTAKQPYSDLSSGKIDDPSFNTDILNFFWNILEIWLFSFLDKGILVVMKSLHVLTFHEPPLPLWKVWFKQLVLSDYSISGIQAPLSPWYLCLCFPYFEVVEWVVYPPSCFLTSFLFN